MTPTPLPKLLLVNGGVRGRDGDSARALDHAAALADERALVSTLVLAGHGGSIAEVRAAMAAADAFVFASGTYWGSWGSPLQRLLEVLTVDEGAPALLGKPAGAVITMDSVGGVDVGTRLLGVCGLLGMLVPPQALVVLSRTGAAARATRPAEFGDVWSVDDLAVLVDNVLAHAGAPVRARTWSVERTRVVDGPFASLAPLEMGVPPAVAGR